MRISPRALRGTALVLLLVAAVAVGFGALRFARPAASLPDAEAVSSVTSLPSPREALPPSRTEVTPGAAPSDAPASATKANPPQEARRAAAPAAAAKPAASPSDDVPPVPTARAISLFAVAPEPPPPQPAVAPAPVARPLPVPDRWQLMADAISQCGREGLLASVICEQRVRLQYCEGYWGQASQCPSGIANDHGQ
jgi:hypothetical protein